MQLQNTQSPVNDSATSAQMRTPLTQPRSLSDLRAFLHGYRIRSAGNLARSTRASIIIGGLDEGHMTPMMRRAASELAERDPSLSWLPDWKPRVAVSAAAKGDGT